MIDVEYRCDSLITWIFYCAQVEAWLADKDAEALRFQKLLVEEEEAAQRRCALLDIWLLLFSLLYCFGFANIWSHFLLQLINIT